MKASPHPVRPRALPPLRARKTLTPGARVVGTLRTYATREACLAASIKAQPDSRSVAAAKVAEAERKAKFIAAMVTTTPAHKARLLALLRESASVDADSQCRRLLRALQEVGPLTTTQVRDYLDIQAPAARISSLRDQGHDIATVWVKQATTAAGVPHRFAQYVLTRGVGNG